MFVCHPGFDLWRLAAQPAAIQARAARIRCPSSDAKSAGVAPPGGRQGTGQLRLPAARRGMFSSGDARRRAAGEAAQGSCGFQRQGGACLVVVMQHVLA